MEGETSANIGETAPASELPGQTYTKIDHSLENENPSGVGANQNLRANSVKGDFHILCPALRRELDWDLKLKRLPPPK